MKNFSKKAEVSIVELTSFIYTTGTSNTRMVNIHPNYDLLEEISAEEHLGEFEI
jgi:hypothetical protein